MPTQNLPSTDELAEAIALHWNRLHERFSHLYLGPLSLDAATFKGLLESGVILPGPAVTGQIEEAE